MTKQTTAQTLAQIIAALSETATAVQTLNARIDALTNPTVVPVASAPQTTVQTSTPSPTTPPTTPPTTRRRRQHATATAEKYPKSTGGTVTGTVAQSARNGYGLCIETTTGRVWVNAVSKGVDARPIFQDLKIGSAVSYDVSESGHVTTTLHQQDTAPATPTAAPDAPKRRGRPARAAALVTTPPVIATAVQPSTIGVIGKGCPTCGGNHGNENMRARIDQCLTRVYTRETGAAVAMIDPTFEAWKLARLNGTAVQSTLVKTTTPPVTVSKPASMSVESLVAQGYVLATDMLAGCDEQFVSIPTSKRAVKITDGKFIVTLVKFAKTTGREMIQVHNLTDGFVGNDGAGQWLPKMAPGIYSKLVTFSPNDRLAIVLKAGVLTKVTRVASIEKDSGVTPGIQGSGTAQPMIQVTGQRANDTKTEATAAARKAQLRAARGANISNATSRNPLIEARRSAAV